MCQKALHFEEEAKNGMGAAVAEKVLQVTENILHEVSSTQQVLVRSISQEVREVFAPPPPPPGVSPRVIN